MISSASSMFSRNAISRAGEGWPSSVLKLNPLLALHAFSAFVVADLKNDSS